MIRSFIAAALLLTSSLVYALTPLQTLNYEGAIPGPVKSCTGQAYGYPEDRIFYCYILKIEDHLYSLITDELDPYSEVLFVLDFGVYGEGEVEKISVEEFISRQDDANSI